MALSRPVRPPNSPTHPDPTLPQYNLCRRTHAFRRPPKRERGRPRHTHTHTIYAVRRVYSAGAHPVASPPSPVSHRLASASLAVSEPTPPQPHPTSSSPESACAQAERRPQYLPPSGESMDATARAWLTQSCPTPFPHTTLFSHTRFKHVADLRTNPFNCSRFTRRN